MPIDRGWNMHFRFQLRAHMLLAQILVQTLMVNNGYTRKTYSACEKAAYCTKKKCAGTSCQKFWPEPRTNFM